MWWKQLDLFLWVPGGRGSARGERRWRPISCQNQVQEDAAARHRLRKIADAIAARRRRRRTPTVSEEPAPSRRHPPTPETCKGPIFWREIGPTCSSGVVCGRPREFLCGL